MPEVLGEPPSPRTALFWNGTAWQWARVDAAGHIQIDVLSTVMDAAAATAANQALMITALQLIDNLVVVLGGPGNVRLQVRGEDQLFSYDDVVYETLSNLNAAAGVNSLVSTTPLAGQVHVITSICAHNVDTACTRISVGRLRAAVYYAMENVLPTAPYDMATWSGWLPIENGDQIFAWFDGCALNDDIYLDINGFRMTLEV